MGERYAKNREEILERERQRQLRKPESENRRAVYVQKTWGMERAEYEALLARGCAICGCSQDDRTIHLDHDHSTGKIREPLCTSCNTGLGLLRDDPELLEAAIAYLRKHSAGEGPSIPAPAAWEAA